MAIPALTKPLDELTSNDIDELVSSEIQEGVNVEFKRGLSSSGSSEPRTGKFPITNRDKASILKEIVAFANGYGGRLFLGIAEKDATASEVVPVSDCVDKADRFERICGTSIDPPMLRLQVKGVETDEDRSGVIVFDVPRSTRSPHMSKRDNQAYMRRGTESVPMDMRDIQDMTLRSASRFSEIEAKFGRRKDRFGEFAKAFSTMKNEGYCFRMSFVPLDDVDLGHVHGNQDVTPQIVDIPLHLNDKDHNNTLIHGVHIWGSPSHMPVIRGTEIGRSEEYSNFQCFQWKITLWSNGGLETWFGFSEPNQSEVSKLFSDWIVTWLANSLRNIERVRRYVGMPTLSYGLETQLKIFGRRVNLRRFREIEPIFDSSSYLECGDHSSFPRYPVGASDEFDEVVNLFLRDWFNAAGTDFAQQIVVDYQLTSTE